MKEQGHVGNTEKGMAIYRKVGVWYLCFTLTPVSTVGLISSWRAELRVRVSE